MQHKTLLVRCPRCGHVEQSTIVISGTAFVGWDNCHLPVSYYSAYKKEYETTPDCPFCEGLGELNYMTSRGKSHLWGPCLYCRLDDYEAWKRRTGDLE